MKYILAIDTVDGVPTCYLANGAGDPPRTCIKDNARRFDKEGSVYIALGKAMNQYKSRDFSTYKIIIEVDE